MASDAGFSGSDEGPHVRKVLRGIVALHPASEKRAKPVQLAQLEKLTAWLDQQIAREADGRERLACIRNRALVLLGFWLPSAASLFSRALCMCVVFPAIAKSVFQVHYIDQETE